jgi:hypothetical protein
LAQSLVQRNAEKIDQLVQAFHDLRFFSGSVLVAEKGAIAIFEFNVEAYPKYANGTTASARPMPR